MCQFFSFLGDGFGNYIFTDWEARQVLIKAKSDSSPDSHTYILDSHGIPVDKHDKWSKYEYNPLTGKFTVDQGVTGHDHEQAQKWVQARDWSMIVEPLVVKPIVNPLTGRAKKVSQADIDCLEAWDSVRDSVRASVWVSVWDSVGNPSGLPSGPISHLSLP